ncbi:MAG: ATP-dependent DNA helicase RecQ [Candidatus Brocadiae bacterium]|nr:ATP-dependent DNA helicase RecQ [Candidatus Brocadiia bacterium]
MAYEAELTRLFGYARFRPGQQPIVEALMSGRPALGILPTGGGKSLCYQLPALLLPGMTVVVSPLIALMKDQVDGLRARGIEGVVEIHSSLDPGEARRRLREAAAGRVKLLFLAPERLALPGVVELIRRTRVSLFVVDEAHCISHWGHDFRPEYLHLAGRARHFGAPVMLALTATATPRVREEIVARLGMESPCVVVNSFDRPNLWMGAAVCEPGQGADRAARLFGREGSGIVYVGRQADTVTVAGVLSARGIPSVPYHGGMDRETRTRNQDAWIQGAVRVVVGTVAFGMGIDKPDVRTVVHLTLPPSLEAWYQESGRAGRDGLPSDCWLLCSGRDHSRQAWFLQRRYPSHYQLIRTWELLTAGKPPTPDELPAETWTAAVAWLRAHDALPPRPLPDPLDLAPLRERRAGDEHRLAAIADWSSTGDCRRATLLRYFGEPVPPGMDCRACDNCCRRAGHPHPQARALGVYAGRAEPDRETIERAILDAVSDTGRFRLGRARLRTLLAGHPSAARQNLQRLSHFASLRGLPPSRFHAAAEALLEDGLLDAVPGAEPALAPARPRNVLTPAEALPILRIVGDEPWRHTRSALARRLGEDRQAWSDRIETLARTGYLDSNADARVVLTLKGRQAVEAAARRGAV